MQEPADGLGKSLRFGCGALFGAVAGAGTFFMLIPEEWLVAVLVAGALLCGFLAMIWGNEFWTWIAEHSWWFRG